MILTCPACGGRWFTKGGLNRSNRIAYDGCTHCSFPGRPVMMTVKDRTALREKYERAQKAMVLPKGYDQARFDRETDEMFGPKRTN